MATITADYNSECSCNIWSLSMKVSQLWVFMQHSKPVYESVKHRIIVSWRQIFENDPVCDLKEYNYVHNLIHHRSAELKKYTYFRLRTFQLCLLMCVIPGGILYKTFDGNIDILRNFWQGIKFQNFWHTTWICKPPSKYMIWHDIFPTSLIY